MSIELALADAARNCWRDGALCTLTLRSGATFTGKLKDQSDLGTWHILIDDGWATVRADEIAAVHSHR